MARRQRTNRLRAFIALIALCTLVAGKASADATLPAPITLSPQEQAWLAAHPVVRFGSDPAWPPMSIAVQDELTGIDADFLKLVSERTGLRFQFVPAASWSDTWQLVEKRAVDVVTGIAQTPERDQLLNFTEPYISFPVAIITRTDGHFLTGASDLDHLRIAAPRDYATTLELEKTHPAAHFIYSANVEQALANVASGKADVTIQNIAVSSYYIHHRGLVNLKISGVFNSDFGPRFATRNDWPELAGILQKGIASITPLEREAICARWILPDVQGATRLHFWRRAVIYGGSVILLVLLVMFVYNRRLAAEIQRRHQTEARFKATQDRLVHLNDQKTWFLNIVAHDLKNPIFGVLMAADMLEELGAAPDGMAKKLLDTISESGWRMDRLVKNLLNFNAIEQGSLTFTHKIVDASAKLREVASRHQHAADTKEVKLAVDAPNPAAFIGDPDGFVEIVENILANAMKFSTKGGTIHIAVTVADGKVRVRIQDNGPGIAAADLPDLFKRPTEVRLKPTSGGGSTGLGLSIARYFTEAMDGKIWCESQPGEGAAFFLEFTQARV